MVDGINQTCSYMYKDLPNANQSYSSTSSNTSFNTSFNTTFNTSSNTTFNTTFIPVLTKYNAIGQKFCDVLAQNPRIKSQVPRPVLDEVLKQKFVDHSGLVEKMTGLFQEVVMHHMSLDCQRKTTEQCGQSKEELNQLLTMFFVHQHELIVQHAQRQQAQQHQQPQQHQQHVPSFPQKNKEDKCVDKFVARLVKLSVKFSNSTLPKKKIKHYVQPCVKKMGTEQFLRVIERAREGLNAHLIAKFTSEVMQQATNRVLESQRRGDRDKQPQQNKTLPSSLEPSSIALVPLVLKYASEFLSSNQHSRSEFKNIKASVLLAAALAAVQLPIAVMGQPPTIEIVVEDVESNTSADAAPQEVTLMAEEQRISEISAAVMLRVRTDILDPTGDPDAQFWVRCFVC